MNRLAFYKTSEDLEEEDIGFDTPLYSIDFYDKEYVIALGHERKLDAKKNTYYFPVYLITDIKDDPAVFKQIGVYEFESSEKSQKERLRPFLDKDGEIDPKRLQDILLYPYADRDFFDNSTFAVTKSDIAQMEDTYGRANRKTSIAAALDEPNPEDPLELTIPVGKVSASVMKSREVLKEGVFERDPTIKIPATLIEENKEESLRIKKEFKQMKQNKWVANFMKNNNYDIVGTSDNGDCYFDTVRQAFLQIGYVTTIEKLRAIVANSADEELFNFYSSQYEELSKEKVEVERQIKELRNDTIKLKKRLKTIEQKSENKDEIKIIQDKIQENITKYNENTEFLSGAFPDLMSNFKFMEDIKSLEGLREYMKTNRYWADERAIAVLEKELSFKTIVFAEYNYRAGDLNWILEDRKNSKKDRVFICTTGEPTEPKFYIMAEHSGKHYQLITYKQKYIMTFSEIPYDIKIMIVIKCMESSASIYNRITSFRNFQAKLGVSVGEMDEDSDSDSGDNEIKGGAINHDAKVRLVFYNKSADGVAPGKGSYEKMPTGNYAEYAELFLKKNREWRKKLDDYWPTEFKLDGLRWYSVEHYYQASKFRKTHPEFYKSFSLDGNPDISQDVDMARIAGSKTGVYKETQLRPSNIKVDSDFYGGRYREEREKAVYAKFTQNEDLKKILLLTKDAKLVKYVPKREMETDHILMKVRKMLRTE
jgi:predicted NAD-dependent protein-ADP-ribosyltransferase YbiA (DUF1768 family)